MAEETIIYSKLSFGSNEARDVIVAVIDIMINWCYNLLEGNKSSMLIKVAEFDQEEIKAIYDILRRVKEQIVAPHESADVTHSIEERHKTIKIGDSAPIMVPEYIYRIYKEKIEKTNNIYEMLIKQVNEGILESFAVVNIIDKIIFETALSNIRESLSAESRSVNVLVDATSNLRNLVKITEQLKNIFIDGELFIKPEVLRHRIEEYKEQFFKPSDAEIDLARISTKKLSKDEDDDQDEFNDVQNMLDIYDQKGVRTGGLFSYASISSQNKMVEAMFNYIDKEAQSADSASYIQYINKKLFKSSKNNILLKYLEKEHKISYNENSTQSIDEVLIREIDRNFDESSLPENYKEDIKKVKEIFKKSIDKLISYYNDSVAKGMALLKYFDTMLKEMEAYKNVIFDYMNIHNDEKIYQNAIDILSGEQYDKSKSEFVQDNNYADTFRNFYFESALFLVNWALARRLKELGKEFSKSKYAVNPVRTNKISWNLPLSFFEDDNKVRTITDEEAAFIMLIMSYIVSILHTYQFLKNNYNGEISIETYASEMKKALELFMKNYAKSFTNIIIKLTKQITNIGSSISDHSKEKNKIAETVDKLNRAIDNINKEAIVFKNRYGLKSVNDVVERNDFITYMKSKDINFWETLIEFSKIAESSPFYYARFKNGGENELLIPFVLEELPYYALHLREINRMHNFVFVASKIIELFPLFGCAINFSQTQPAQDYYVYETMCYTYDRGEFYGVDPDVIATIKIKNYNLDAEEAKKALKDIINGINQVSRIRSNYNMLLTYESLDKEQSNKYKILKESNIIDEKFNVMFHSALTRYLFQINIFKIMKNYQEVLDVKEGKRMSIAKLLDEIQANISKEVNDIDTIINDSQLRGEIVRKLAVELSIDLGNNSELVSRFKSVIGYVKSIGDRIGYHVHFPMQMKTQVVAVRSYYGLNVLQYVSEKTRNFIAQMRGRILDNNRMLTDALKVIIGVGTPRYDKTGTDAERNAGLLRKMFAEDPMLSPNITDEL